MGASLSTQTKIIIGVGSAVVAIAAAAAVGVLMRKKGKDTDGDGVGDNADAFPNDPDETNDADSDGVGDNADAFPNDPDETNDADSDGVGNNADAFPNDPDETNDADSDGVGDNADAFPNDPNRTSKQTIKIGLLNDATGPIAVYAAAFRSAAAIAANALTEASDKYRFEIVEADSGCSKTRARSAARSLIAAEVVAVAGAACSGASTGANEVLSAAGIPMISYASTSPNLSDSTKYPLFFRVVDSDSLQGETLATVVAAHDVKTPAVFHLADTYGQGLADSFESSWLKQNKTLCLRLALNESENVTRNLGIIAKALKETENCDAVALLTGIDDVSDEGGLKPVMDIISNALGPVPPVFGGDDFSSNGGRGLGQGVIVMKPTPADMPAGWKENSAFLRACAKSECRTGIYTAETFDAVTMIGRAVINFPSEDIAAGLKKLVYVGESGVLRFKPNGDVDAEGRGYEVCPPMVATTDGCLSSLGEYLLPG